MSSSGTTWAGAVISGLGAITVSQWLAVGGFLLAVAGFSVNLWHKRQDIKIKREQLERSK